ncbi:hypothetical protein ACET3Z_000286 [Daucus carota]
MSWELFDQQKQLDDEFEHKTSLMFFGANLKQQLSCLVVPKSESAREQYLGKIYGLRSILLISQLIELQVRYAQLLFEHQQ